MATLVSVTVGMPTDVQWQGRVVRTGVYKRPPIVKRPVTIGDIPDNPALMTATDQPNNAIVAGIHERAQTVEEMRRVGRRHAPSRRPLAGHRWCAASTSTGTVRAMSVAMVASNNNCRRRVSIQRLPVIPERIVDHYNR